MTRCAISGARSAVKIFLFPVAKRAGAVCTVYTSRLKERTRAIRATNRCFIRACPARRIEEDRPPPPLADLHQSFTLSIQPRPYVYTRWRKGPKPRDSQAAENPTRVFDRLLVLEHLSCLARLAQTYAAIRPYTCNYLGQSVPVKSHASSYIYPKVNGHGIRCADLWSRAVACLRFFGCCNFNLSLFFFPIKGFRIGSLISFFWDFVSK